MTPDLFEPAPPIFIADRAQAEAALALIATHGADAGFQAAARARRARDLGNVPGFCRWRQIERLIAMLEGLLPVTFH